MTDCSKIPTLTLVEDSKKAMEDVAAFTGSPETTYESRLDGSTRDTLTGLTEEAREAFRLSSDDPQGNYVVGVFFNESNWTYFYNNEYWGLSDDFDLSTLPYEATQADPNNDPNLQVRSNASQSYVQVRVKSAEERGLGPGTSLYQGTATLNGEKYVQNGDAVPSGTTHLSVLIDGKPEVVLLTPMLSGIVSSVTEDSADIGGTNVNFTAFYKRNFKTVGDMLEGKTFNGWRYTTGGTSWDQVSGGGSSIDDFSEINAVHVKDFLEAGDVDYTGALARALEFTYSSGKCVTLSRDMVVDGQIDIGYMDYSEPVRIIGGSILRNVDGPIFYSSVPDLKRDAPIFERVGFYGAGGGVKPVVFDGDGSIRHQFYHCYFRQFSLIHTDKYIQSLRFVGNTMYSAPDSFIKSPVFWDMKVSQNQLETSGSHFIEATGTTTALGPYAFTGCMFNDNLLEAYTVTPIVGPNCSGLSIKNNYFEAVQGVFGRVVDASDPNTNYQMYGFECVGNYIGKVTGNLALDIPTGRLVGETISSNFCTFETSDLVNNALIAGYLNESGNARNRVVGGLLSLSKVFHTVRSEISTQRFALAYQINDLAGGGKSIDVKNLVSSQDTRTANNVLCGNPCLVAITGQYASGSTNYRFNYTGILTFSSAFLNEVLLEVAITPLVQMHTNGSNTVGQTGDPSDVVVHFPGAGNTKPYSNTHGETTVVIDLPNIIDVSSVTITPLNNVMVESAFHVMPFYN